MSQACRKATELISKGMDHPLTWRERLALGFHLAVCRGCRRFRAQVRLMRRAIRNTASMGDPPPITGVGELSKDARSRIEAALRRGV